MQSKKYIYSVPVMVMAAIFIGLLAIALVSCQHAGLEKTKPQLSVLDTENCIKTGSIILETKNYNADSNTQNDFEDTTHSVNTGSETARIYETVKMKGEQVLKEIDEMLEQQVPPYNALLFLDKNINILSKDDACRAIDSIEGLLFSYETKYSEILTNDVELNFQQKLNDFAASFGIISDGEINREQAANIWDEELSSFADELFESGFKLANFEGMWLAVIDYKRLATYTSYLEPDYAEYIYFRTIESGKIYVKDAALKISWDEIALRLLDAEDFMSAYPKSKKYHLVAGRYYDYLSAYMTGLNNTPSFDYGSNMFKAEALKSYENMIKNSRYAGFYTVDLVKSFLKAIKKNEYVMNEKVREFIKQSYEESGKHFGENNPYA